jgi:hypothetical protein
MMAPSTVHDSADAFIEPGEALSANGTYRLTERYVDITGLIR